MKNFITFSISDEQKKNIMHAKENIDIQTIQGKIAIIVEGKNILEDITEDRIVGFTIKLLKELDRIISDSSKIYPVKIDHGDDAIIFGFYADKLMNLVKCFVYDDNKKKLLCNEVTFSADEFCTSVLEMSYNLEKTIFKTQRQKMLSPYKYFKSAQDIALNYVKNTRGISMKDTNITKDFLM